jgi:hypothetical protein
MLSSAYVLGFSALVAIAASSGSGAPVPVLGPVAVTDTCAFTKAGRRIGCLQTVYGENVSVWRQGVWLFMGQGLPKDIGRPKPEVAAKRLRSNVWAVLRWSDGRPLGRVVAANARRTHWNIANARGALVATARGPDGPKVGMAILYYGPDLFG